MYIGPYRRAGIVQRWSTGYWTRRETIFKRETVDLSTVVCIINKRTCWWRGWAWLRRALVYSGENSSSICVFGYPYLHHPNFYRFGKKEDIHDLQVIFLFFSTVQWYFYRQTGRTDYTKTRILIVGKINIRNNRGRLGMGGGQKPRTLGWASLIHRLILPVSLPSSGSSSRWSTGCLVENFIKTDMTRKFVKHLQSQTVVNNLIRKSTNTVWLTVSSTGIIDLRLNCWYCTGAVSNCCFRKG